MGQTVEGMGGEQQAVKQQGIARHSRIAETGARVLLAGDLGCLMNMAGKLKRQGSRVEARHVAEVLAGMADGPAIGEAE